MELSLIQKVAVWAIPVLFAVTVHEAAHAWSADKLGDPTARSLGRVSFNPIKHIDLIGTIVVPILLMLVSSFIFGWAKPVPINTQNFYKPQRDFAIVAIFGPLSNLLMAVGWSLVFAIGYYFSPDTQQMSVFLLLRLMGEAGVLINVMLMVFNLLPIPPLDGSRLVMAILPKQMNAQIALYEQYGLVILIALMFLGLAQYLLPWIIWIGKGMLGWFLF